MCRTPNPHALGRLLARGRRQGGMHQQPLPAEAKQVKACTKHPCGLRAGDQQASRYQQEGNGQYEATDGGVINHPACPGQRDGTHHGACYIKAAQPAVIEPQCLTQVLPIKRYEIGLSETRHCHQYRAKSQMAAVLIHKVKQLTQGIP